MWKKYSDIEKTEKNITTILAEKMQVNGIDIDKNAIQRIESGKRFVTDIELKAFANFFNINMDELTR